METNTATPEQIQEAHNIWQISNGRHEGGKWRVHNTETNTGFYLATHTAYVNFIEQTVAPTITTTKDSK
jgi:hypothetical protein